MQGKADEIIQSIQSGLIVSLRHDEETSLGPIEYAKALVPAVLAGGCVGLRIEGPETIRAVRSMTKLPIVGYKHGTYEDGSDLITPALEDIAELLDAGADVIAVDATARKRSSGELGGSFLQHAKEEYNVPIWADCSTYEDSVHAASVGADFVATTLAGYTASTASVDAVTPDYKLIKRLSQSLMVPVIAEGRIWRPEDASNALKAGAHAVVVGTAITRPSVLTKMFAAAMKSSVSRR